MSIVPINHCYFKRYLLEERGKEMIKERMDRNAATYGTMERQKDTAVPQGKTKAGRTVAWKKPVAIQVPSQTTRELGGSQFYQSRSVKRTSRSPLEVVSAKKPRIMKEAIEQWIKCFKNQVDDMVQKLQEEYKRAPDKSLFCLKVIDTVSDLKKNLDKKNRHLMHADFNDCKRYMISETVSLYNTTFGITLKSLQNQVQEGKGWICFDNLCKVTRYFKEFSDYNHKVKDHEANLLMMWQAFGHRELDYLKFLEDSPDDKYSASLAIKNIRYLASSNGFPIPKLELIFNDDDINNIKELAETTYQEAINSNRNKSDTRGKNKHHNKKVADMMVKRRYHDQLYEQFEKVRGEETRERTTIDWYIRLLEKLKQLRDEHDKLVGNIRTPLIKKLEKEIPLTGKRIQIKMEKGHTHDDDQLKKKSIALTKHLTKEDSQYNNLIDGIYRDYDCNHNYMKTVSKVKELLIKYDHNLIPKDKRRLDNLIHLVRKTFSDPVFGAYDDAINFKKSSKEISTEMHKYKNKFIELNKSGNENMLVKSKPKLQTWRTMACFAWSDDIDELCKKSSFNEHDIDDLLHLKSIVPDPLQNEHIKNHFQTALKNMLMFMSENDPGVGLTKRVMRLSKWVKELGKQHEIDPMLHRANKKWQEKQKRQVISATSSGTSVGAHPGTAGVSLKASDRYPYMEQQNASHMRQPSPSLFKGGATPAATQQPVPIAHYTPMAQSSDGIRPQLPPPSMSVPATAQPLQQPASLAHHTPIFQSPAGIRPQLPLPSMSVPEIVQTLQQLASIAQSLAEIPPQPLSAHHEASTAEWLPRPEMVSHFSAYSHTRFDARQPSVYGYVQSQTETVFQQHYGLQSTASPEFSTKYSRNSDTQ